MFGLQHVRRRQGRHSFYQHLSGAESLEPRTAPAEWLVGLGSVAVAADPGLWEEESEEALALRKPSLARVTDPFESRREWILAPWPGATPQNAAGWVPLELDFEGTPLQTSQVEPQGPEADQPSVPSAGPLSAPAPSFEGADPSLAIYPLVLAAPEAGSVPPLAATATEEAAPGSGGASRDSGGWSSSSQDPSGGGTPLLAASEANTLAEGTTSASSSSAMGATPMASPLRGPGEVKPAPSGGGPLAVAWTRGGVLDSMAMADPYYVVDWNDGLTLSPGAVEYESEGDSVDLRAQVQGAPVASYAWDLSQAPLARDVVGATPTACDSTGATCHMETLPLTGFG